MGVRVNVKSGLNSNGVPANSSWFISTGIDLNSLNIFLIKGPGCELYLCYAPSLISAI